MVNEGPNYVKKDRELDKLRHFESIILGIASIILATISIIYSIIGIKPLENIFLSVVMIANALTIGYIIKSAFSKENKKRVKTIVNMMGVVSLILLLYGLILILEYIFTQAEDIIGAYCWGFLVFLLWISGWIFIQNKVEKYLNDQFPSIVGDEDL